MRRIGIVACTVLPLVGGCSSGPSPSARSNTSTTAAANRPAEERAAIRFANRMLDDAIVPAGKLRSEAGLPQVLHAPLRWPDAKQIVQTHRVWSVSAKLADVAGFLHANTPPGYDERGRSSGTTRGVKSYGFDQYPRVLPPNISSAYLEVSVAADGPDASFVRADATVGWTYPRPADEFVPSRDRVVIVTVVRDFLPGKPRGKRVVATDPKLVRPIVTSFNALRVSAPPTPHSCPPMGRRSVSYHIAFTTSPAAPPDIVAAFGACGNVGVTVHGRDAPDLGDFVPAEFGNAVAHVLGLAEPHLG